MLVRKYRQSIQVLGEMIRQVKNRLLPQKRYTQKRIDAMISEAEVEIKKLCHGNIQAESLDSIGSMAIAVEKIMPTSKEDHKKLIELQLASFDAIEHIREILNRKACLLAKKEARKNPRPRNYLDRWFDFFDNQKNHGYYFENADPFGFRIVHKKRRNATWICECYQNGNTWYLCNQHIHLKQDVLDEYSELLEEKPRVLIEQHRILRGYIKSRLRQQRKAVSGSVKPAAKNLKRIHKKYGMRYEIRNGGDIFGDGKRTIATGRLGYGNPYEEIVREIKKHYQITDIISREISKNGDGRYEPMYLHTLTSRVEGNGVLLECGCREMFDDTYVPCDKHKEHPWYFGELYEIHIETEEDKVLATVYENSARKNGMNPKLLKPMYLFQDKDQSQGFAWLRITKCGCIVVHFCEGIKSGYGSYSPTGEEGHPHEYGQVDTATFQRMLRRSKTLQKLLLNNPRISKGFSAKIASKIL